MKIKLLIGFVLSVIISVLIGYSIGFDKGKTEGFSFYLDELESKKVDTAVYLGMLYNIEKENYNSVREALIIKTKISIENPIVGEYKESTLRWWEKYQNEFCNGKCDLPK